MSETSLLNAIRLRSYSDEKLLQALVNTAQSMGLAYACWKQPQENTFYFLADLSDNIQRTKLSLENGKTGFIIQPFLKEESENPYVLSAGILFSTHTTSFSFDAACANPMQKERFLTQFLSRLQMEEEQHVELPKASNEALENQSTEQYTNLVRQAKTEIEQQRFKKVVLARNKEVRLKEGYSLAALFHKTAKAYPNAFVSLVGTKALGIWINATPEILVGIDVEGIFRTTALAGTQKLGEGNDLSKAVWTQKEIEEQALVSRYIINCFKKIRLREFEEDGPKTVASGDLAHLRTDFLVDSKTVNFPELGTVMLELLHPTSAVCGMPKEDTLAFIKNYEGLDRSLFSGYSGPVNLNLTSQLYVNLRCARLFASKAILYAGAGITQDSDPLKELTETEIKMEIIGRFLPV